MHRPVEIGPTFQDTSATDSEVENKVKLLENKIDTMSKTFENKFEGLSELVKKFIDNNSGSDVSAIVNSDGNEGAVNNTSAAFNRVDIIENNLGNVVDDVTSIKDTLTTLTQSINQVQKTYAKAVTSTSAAGRQHQYGPALPDLWEISHIMSTLSSSIGWSCTVWRRHAPFC